MPGDRTIEVESTQLLRTLIRSACVNDGTVASGQEVRSADALEDYFAGSGLSLERYAAAPGRVSLLARIEGRAGRRMLRPGRPRKKVQVGLFQRPASPAASGQAAASSSASSSKTVGQRMMHGPVHPGFCTRVTTWRDASSVSS